MFGLAFYCKMTKKPSKISHIQKPVYLHYRTLHLPFLSPRLPPQKPHLRNHLHLEPIWNPSPFISILETISGRRRYRNQVAGDTETRSPENAEDTETRSPEIQKPGRRRNDDGRPEQGSEQVEGIYVLLFSKRSELIKKSGEPDFCKIMFPL